MGKKPAGSKAGDGSANLRNRIEGFGNAPMPPPVPDTFEDRLHSALSQDETIGDWYNSAKAGMDAMVTAFDDTVNAIADTIEDTVAAVVGDDDAWDPDPPTAKTQQKQRRKKSKDEQDDGERSDIKWEGVVEKICDEGDLDNFVTLLQSSPANNAEEREVAGLLSEQLLKADKPSNTLRVLYVMQSVEEGDLPIVMDVIRVKCLSKLEKLKTQTFYRALATQVLGDGPAPKKDNGEDAKNAENKTEASKQAPKPVDLLDVNDTVTAKPGSSSKAASSSSGLVDLLDSSPAAAPAAKMDLLDMAAPAAPAGGLDLLSLDATPTLQPMAPIPGPRASPAASLISFDAPAAAPAAASFPNMMQPQTAPAFAAFQSASPSPPQQNAGQNAFAAFQSANSGPAGMGSSSLGGMNSMPQPFGSMSSASGYQQGGAAATPLLPISNGFDAFDPNSSKPSGPAIKVTRGMAGMSMSGSSSSAAAHDPFASLDLPSMGQPAGTMASAGASGRTSANQPAAKKDPFEFDDVLSTELNKMKLVT